MFDFKEDKQKREDKEKLRVGALTFIGIGIILIIIGVALIMPAFAVNVTAIDEIKNDLAPQLEYANTFPVFYLIFLLIILAVFMLTSFARRTEREMIFFSIGAVIVSFTLTLIFISPVSFDYTIETQQINIEEIEYLNGSVTYNAGISKDVQLIEVIPADSAFRMILSLLFTGISLFNGMYAIMIMTQFSTKGKLGL